MSKYLSLAKELHAGVAKADCPKLARARRQVALKLEELDSLEKAAKEKPAPAPSEPEKPEASEPEAKPDPGPPAESKPGGAEGSAQA